MAALSPDYFTNTKKLRNKMLLKMILKIWHCDSTQGTTLLVLLAQKKKKKKKDYEAYTSSQRYIMNT